MTWRVPRGLLNSNNEKYVNQPLNIGSRAYKYIRSGAVRSIPDALIELITNAQDAYNKDTTLTPEYFG